MITWKKPLDLVAKGMRTENGGLKTSLLEYLKQLSQKVSSYQVTLMENCYKQLQLLNI